MRGAVTDHGTIDANIGKPPLRKLKIKLHAKAEPKRKQSKLFIIAKTFKAPSDQRTYVPIPGSLEEDLSSTPDSFFDPQPHLLPPLASNKGQQLWTKLPEKGLDNNEYEVEWGQQRIVKPRPFNLARDNVSPLKILNPDNKKGRRKKDITDEGLKEKYMQLQSTFYAPIVIKKPKQRTERTERSVGAHNTMRKIWQSTLKDACDKLGRPLEDSVIYNAEKNREKIEQRVAGRPNGPSSFRNFLNWHVTLRSSSRSKERRGRLLPFGNNYSGLWINLIDNSDECTNVGRKYTSSVLDQNKQYNTNHETAIEVSNTNNTAILTTTRDERSNESFVEKDEAAPDIQVNYCDWSELFIKM